MTADDLPLPTLLSRLLNAFTIEQRHDDGRARLSPGAAALPGRVAGQAPYLRQTTAVLDDPGAALPHYPMVLHRGGWPDGS